ncbi:PAN2-PAN3 deadenylation complex catalytic subunit PAN2 isoform X2 [Chrysoperla carnea]|uniref:PAN2-PAN3 deadenylation complex catalytic subunit PAN2 isoform X2 n=1 Tax=Chrysoperla carnea TaxID=189513 RepID=UPI001D084B7F|nr:PAN2-PAN3 deadenylation complex catalytic subunit PAN2 isoform X2 [Chrysoperla carnea]
MEFHYDGPVETLDNSAEMLSIYRQIDPNAEYLETQCILADGGDRFGVAAVTFDPHEELLWMGNQGGHVTSYYGSGMQKYTSFQVHATQDIRHLTMIDEGILALTATSLRYQMRRGIPIFTYSSSNLVEMQCMLQLSPTRLLMAGHQDKMIDFNLTIGKETELIPAGESGCALLRMHNRFVCAGDPLGRITLRDPNSLSIEHSLETHSGSLSDFDVQGNLLITCGFSSRQGGVTCDRFLMVYDLRMLRVISPIQVVVDPLYLRFLPSVTSRLAVITALGQIQLVDTVSLSEPRMCLYQMNNTGAMCMAFDVASTSQAMVLGDSAGNIHLFTAANTSSHDVVFNTYSRPTEHADPVDMSMPTIAYDDFRTPLSVVPLPVISNGTPLASDWPSQFMKRVYRRPPGIDPEILRTMKMQGPIGYAPNPKSTRRNQVVYPLDKYGSRAQSKLFPSDLRNNKNGTNEESGFIAIPKRYRKIDVKYSKLGIEDFEQFNKTGLPGLEATLPNSYCNPMIQVLYYIEPVRVALLTHTCNKEFCLSCELGFLFHMLDTSAGTPCQPGNFLRAFRTVPEASALGLILSDMHPEAKLKTDLVRLIQSWNRFILHQMHYELLETRKRKIEEQQRLAARETKPFVYKETDFPSILGVQTSRRLRNHGHASAKTNEDDDTADDSKDSDNCSGSKRDEETAISQLFGTKQLHINRCLKCDHELTKESILLVCNLIYPIASEINENNASFIDLLSRSLTPEQTTPAWCDKCARFTPTNQSRHLQSLPQVLSLNCGLENPSDKQFWQQQIDQVVAKSVTTTNNKTTNSTLVNPKPCRYGIHCARPGCRFKHSSDTNKATLTSPSVNHLYYSNSWLPHQIEIKISERKELEIRKINPESDLEENKENKIMDDDDESKSEGTLESNSHLQVVRYTLSSVVCYIHDEKRNLVSLLRIPRSHRTGHEGGDTSQWYLFNDFSVTAVPAQEAVWFSLDWKVPCVLYYVANDLDMTKTDVSNPLTQDVFGQDKCLARSDNSKSITFTPLSAAEMPQPGELIAMDAEFVTLNQEEAELRSDGKLSTIKPSHMSVARITCIRGQGPLEGTPFIDDYISTQEQVVDYLTKFSGIQPGDLDANFSSKHLTTLKATYQKLRFLLDKGVVFVGHGLQNDFRVINLVVPPEQVVDTVELFHLPHQRMVSLRFLAWHFLGTKIQSVTHDSAEDARTALQLYQKYNELQAENKFSQALAHLYEVGKQLQWRVPDD